MQVFGEKNAGGGDFWGLVEGGRWVFGKGKARGNSRENWTGGGGYG